MAINPCGCESCECGLVPKFPEPAGVPPALPPVVPRPIPPNFMVDVAPTPAVGSAQITPGRIVPSMAPAPFGPPVTQPNLYVRPGPPVVLGPPTPPPAVVPPIPPGMVQTGSIMHPPPKPVTMLMDLPPTRWLDQPPSFGPGTMGAAGRVFGRLGLAASVAGLSFGVVDVFTRQRDIGKVEEAIGLIDGELAAMATVITNSGNRAVLADCTRMREDLRQLEVLLRLMLVVWDSLQIDRPAGSVGLTGAAAQRFARTLQAIERLRVTINGFCANVEAAARRTAQNNTCTRTAADAIGQSLAAIRDVANAAWAGGAAIGRVVISDSDGTNPSVGQTIGSMVSSIAMAGERVTAGTASIADAASTIESSWSQVNNACNLRDNQLNAMYGPGGSSPNPQMLADGRELLRALRAGLRSVIAATLAAIRGCRNVNVSSVMASGGSSMMSNGTNDPPVVTEPVKVYTVAPKFPEPKYQVGV